MKFSYLIKRSLLTAAMAVGTTTVVLAQNLVLVSGTDFEPLDPTTKKDFIDINHVKTIGAIAPTISVGTNMSLPTDDDLYEYDSDGTAIKSNFQSDINLYAVTSNPALIDALDYIDDENWGILFGPQEKENTTFMTYSVKGLVPNKAVKVVVDYRSVIRKDAKSKSVKNCALGGRAEFKIACNADFINSTIGIDAPKIDIPAEETMTLTGKDGGPISSGSNMCADADGNLNINFNNRTTDICNVIQITSIKIYGNISPEIYSEGGDDFCAGERILLKSKLAYEGAKYQWYANGKAIAGATNKDLLFETSAVPSYYVFQLEVTLDNVKTKSNNFEAKTETCCETIDENGVSIPMSRKIIFKEDFGEFDLSDKTGKTYKVWDYSDITNPVQTTKTTTTPFRYELEPAPLGLDFCSDGPVMDGSYTVAGVLTGYNTVDGMAGASLQWANRIGGKEDPRETEYDHSGKLEGCALLVNPAAKQKGKVIYKQEISDLCINRQYSAEMYYTVFTNSSVSLYNPANIIFRLTEIGNEANSVEISGTAYPEIEGGTGTWEKLALEIFLESKGAVKLEVINNTDVCESGNDLVIDDITLKACSTPSLQAYFDVQSFATDTVSCSNDLIKIFTDPSNMLTSYYGGEKNTYYLYQWTKTPENKESWKRLEDPTQDLEMSINSDIFEGLLTGDNVYFRVVAGKQITLSKLSDKEFNPSDPCATYSVSEPIICTINCPACTAPANDIKISVDDPTKVKTVGTKKVVELCYGESVTLSQAEDITPAPSDWAYAEFNGFAIKWFVNATRFGNITDAELVLNGKVADKAIEYDVETLGGTEIAITLYATDANYPDGNCNTSDEIIIKFNPKPIAKYSQDTVVFKEGKGDGVVELTMVDGTEADYNITWWDDADGAGSSLGEGLDEAFFKGLTSDKSGAYSYQLTDKETKCKGDTFNYVVTITSDTTTVSTIAADNNEIVNVYTVSGTLVKANVKKANALVGLKPGVYVVGREKVEVKE